MKIWVTVEKGFFDILVRLNIQKLYEMKVCS